MHHLFANRSRRYTRLWVLFCLGLLLLAGCGGEPPATAVTTPKPITLTVDGETTDLTSRASTVRELLAEAGVTLGDLDEVTPPIFTPLSDDLAITVVRVSESLELIQQTIPFERSIVRNEAMDEDDPPVIVQAGRAGLQETTWRILYRDGLEAERWPTETVVIDPPQEEIVMVGIGAARSNVNFSGVLAYLSDNSAVLMRGSTAFPETVNTGGALDGRVFSLSPSGSHLLYTRIATDTTRFNNSLWVIETTRGAAPQALDVENVLWADWNPAAERQIAFTTALPTDAPPGWEANNDLWLGEIPASPDAAFTPSQQIDTYPATYGWWGGNYAWSPDGRFIGYSFADEVGVIQVDNTGAARHTPLQRFTEYNTLASWVWVPTLTWSPDGRFLAFTQHGSDDDRAAQFDSWVIDVASGVNGRFVSQAGMWGHLHWRRGSADDSALSDGQIAFLRAIDPLDSQRSNYTLWLMDRDGSNARQIYPPIGENSRFPRTPRFMTWGPSGVEIAFVFNDDLYLFNLETGAAQPITETDALISHPSWAPYGAALTGDVAPASSQPPPTATPERPLLVEPGAESDEP